jgi:hypothetical protein
MSERMGTRNDERYNTNYSQEYPKLCAVITVIGRNAKEPFNPVHVLLLVGKGDSTRHNSRASQSGRSILLAAAEASPIRIRTSISVEALIVKHG